MNAITNNLPIGGDGKIPAALIAESGDVSKSRIRRSAILLVVANYAVAFVSMGINMVLANKLGASGYGVFRYGIVIGTFVQCFVNLGSHRTIVRDLTHADDPAAMMSTSLAKRMIATVIVTFIGVIVSLSIDIPGPILFVAWMFGLAAVCTSLSPKGWFDVQYQMHWHTITVLLEKVIFAVMAAAWALGFAGQNLLFGAAVFWFIARAAGLAAQLWFIRKTFKWTDAWNRERLIWLWHENKWIFGAVLGGILASFGTQLVLGSLQGSRAMAHFGMAFSMVAMGQLFITQVDRLMAPKIAQITRRHGKDGIPVARHLLKFAGWAAVGSIAVSGSLAIVGPLAIRIFLGEKFEPSVEILYWLCVWCMLLGMNLVSARFLICLRCHRLQFFTSITRGILAMAFAPYLVMTFGGKGVAFAMIFSALIFLTINYSFLLTTKRFEGEIKAV